LNGRGANENEKDRIEGTINQSIEEWTGGMEEWRVDDKDKDKDESESNVSHSVGFTK
jgi:hypothetical protein